MTTVSVGPFRLIDPPAGQETVIRAAVDAIDFPWERLATAANADPDRAITVEWAALPWGTAALSYNGSLRIVLENRPSTNTGFTFAHEVGHLVDAVCLTGADRATLTDLLHLNAGPVGHNACRDVTLWATDPGDYYWRMREAFADVFVAAFAPTLWPGWRFVHTAADLTPIRRLVLDAGHRLDPTTTPDSTDTSGEAPVLTRGKHIDNALDELQAWRRAHRGRAKATTVIVLAAQTALRSIPRRPAS